MEEPKFNNKIEDLEDQLWDIKQRLEYVESVLEIEPDDEDDDYDPTLHPSMEDDHAGDDDYFDEDDPLKHTHDDGTKHSHQGGDQPHTHEAKKPEAAPVAPVGDSAKRAEDILKLIRSRQAK